MSKQTTSTRRSPDLSSIVRTGGLPSVRTDALDPYVTQCPHWCPTPGQHRYESHAVDRVHQGDPVLVPLELESAQPDEGGHHEPQYTPETATAYLRQNYREREASIFLGKGEGDGMVMTLAEAERVAAALLELVEEGRQ